MKLADQLHWKHSDQELGVRKMTSSRKETLDRLHTHFEPEVSFKSTPTIDVNSNF
jgi:hypothetical protein